MREADSKEDTETQAGTHDRVKRWGDGQNKPSGRQRGYGEEGREKPENMRRFGVDDADGD